jgi:hypothetical protein
MCFANDSIVPHGTKQRAIALFFQRLNRLVRKRSAGLLERVETSIEVDEGELQAKRGWKGFEDPSAGGYDLATDAVARDETLTV